MSYSTHWMDYGGTCEPCPKGCGAMLKWVKFYDTKTSRYVRGLSCLNKKKCGQEAISAGLSKVKESTPMERLNARAR